MKTDCNTSAGSARPELTITAAADQIGMALEQAEAVLNLLANDCFDGQPFKAGSDAALCSLALVSALLDQADNALDILAPSLPMHSGRELQHLLQRLAGLVRLLECNADNTPTTQVFVAASLALQLAEQAKADAYACWLARSGRDEGEPRDADN